MKQAARYLVCLLLLLGTVVIGPRSFSQTQASQVKAPGSIPPYWVDPITGLAWAKKDNGSDATFTQASEYCQTLTLGGKSGWRLPTIDELSGIFVWSKAGQPGLHPKGGISLSWPGVWSSTEGSNSEEKWAFSFYNGSRGSSEIGPGHINRALCVRSYGE